MVMVTRMFKALDVAGPDGRVRHSKLMATGVTIAALLLLAFNCIDSDPEAFVLIALIGVAYGHDWGKTLVKAKYPAAEENSVPSTNGAA